MSPTPRRHRDRVLQLPGFDHGALTYSVDEKGRQGLHAAGCPAIDAAQPRDLSKTLLLCGLCTELEDANPWARLASAANDLDGELSILGTAARWLDRLNNEELHTKDVSAVTGAVRTGAWQIQMAYERTVAIGTAAGYGISELLTRLHHIQDQARTSALNPQQQALIGTEATLMREVAAAADDEFTARLPRVDLPFLWQLEGVTAGPDDLHLTVLTNREDHLRGNDEATLAVRALRELTWMASTPVVEVLEYVTDCARTTRVVYLPGAIAERMGGHLVGHLPVDKPWEPEAAAVLLELIHGKPPTLASTEFAALASAAHTAATT